MWTRALTTALIALASTLTAAADEAQSRREKMYRCAMLIRDETHLPMRL
jgi:hypothetical protein